MAPPPTIRILLGMAVTARASVLVQTDSPISNPGRGSRAGTEPVATMTFRAVIVRELQSPRASGYRLPRHEWLFWRWPNRGTRPNWQLRLFRKSCGGMNAVPIHAAPEVDGIVRNINAPFRHFGEVAAEPFAVSPGDIGNETAPCLCGFLWVRNAGKLRNSDSGNSSDSGSVYRHS